MNKVVVITKDGRTAVYTSEPVSGFLQINFDAAKDAEHAKSLEEIAINAIKDLQPCLSIDQFCPIVGVKEVMWPHEQ